MKLKTFLILVVLVVLVGGLVYYSAQKKRPSSTPSATGGKVLPNLALGGDVAPKITARDGILYQDGKPCFLVGVWCGTGYQPGLWVNYPYCKGYAELVPGLEGKGLKITFEKTDKPVSRWIDFPAFTPGECIEKKYKALKFWVKGDGSKRIVKVRVDYDAPFQAVAVIGEFSLENTDWKQIVLPLEDKYDSLAKANYCNLIPCGTGDEAFHFTLDNITAVRDGGEDVLFDFDTNLTTSKLWSKQGRRYAFRDDPVYKAIWDDPLYREISGENFKSIGMTTFHLQACSEDHVRDIIPAGDSTSLGEITLCAKLNGLPMVPGFLFMYGQLYGGKESEEWAKRNGLPPTILLRPPNGGAWGGYNAICFEDPLGQKVYKEQWQRSARHLLSHGANIYAYELLNELNMNYVCACQYNREAFIKRLREKYKDIKELNTVWGTAYESFEAVQKNISDLGLGDQRIKGLTVAWNKFLEDRCVEFFQQGGDWIHEVEDEMKKPHALMGVMSDPRHDFFGFGGDDMFKRTKHLDLIETEGGVGFGGGQYSGEVNRETAVMASTGYYDHQMALDLADAVCPDKPIINTEHYVTRYKGGVSTLERGAREPTTKADIITSLWEEFIRGASAIHTYNWQVEYLSREDALAEGLRQQMLLSPYVYSRESLNGYKEVQEEISRVADVVMARPRLGRNAQLAVLFSRPTARYLVGRAHHFLDPDWKKKTDFYRSHETFYSYLLENHYPMRYVYEEQLPEGKLKPFQVVFVPHSDNIYPETIKYLLDYAKKGGTLVCFGDALRYDEYGNEKKEGLSELLGLERKKVDFSSETVELNKSGEAPRGKPRGIFAEPCEAKNAIPPCGKPQDFAYSAVVKPLATKAGLAKKGKVKIDYDREVKPIGAEVVVRFPESNRAFMTVNRVGNGRVYYVNADAFRLDRELIRPLLDYIAGEVELKAPIEVVALDGSRTRDIEANVMERKGKKVLFLVNWKGNEDRVVKVRIGGIKEDEKYHLADIAKDSVYTKGGQEIITGKELREGINLFLPSQERVVLLLTREKYRASNKPIELLSEEAAFTLEKGITEKLRAEFEKETNNARRMREIVFGIKGFSTMGIIVDQIKECINSVAGDTLTDILLRSQNNEWEIANYGLQVHVDCVLTYLLTFKETVKDDEKEKILVKVLNALLDKYGDKVKIIKGWKEADILKIKENMLKAREYKATGACLPLDLRKQVNMGFKDEKADDQKGGLFDEGRSLKGLPVGSNTFGGIVFEIIDPEKNNSLACIVLRGKAKPYFPEKAAEILVGRKAKNIYILHGASYCAGDSQEVVYRLKFNYTDNTDAYADIKAGSEITDWFSQSGDQLAGAHPAWVGKAIEKTGNAGEEKEWNICLYCARIANPNPEKEIRTMDIISANNAAVPGIFAISVAEN